MPLISPPELDTQDEDEVTAGVIAALPDELSDRNAGSLVVELVEAIGAFYGLILAALNAWSDRARLKMLALLGIDREEATYATVSLTFSRTVTVDPLTIPAGTVVKTGTGIDAIRFATDAEAEMDVGEDEVVVAATAVEAGASGNVPAATLIYLDQPISGLDGVTNPAAAAGGQDEEPLETAEARAPLAIRSADRCITAEDFAFQAGEVAGVERALAISEYNGQVKAYILAADLNETPNGTLQDAVETRLVERTVPGLLVEVAQEPVTLVMVTDVQVVLEAGYVVADIEDDVEALLARHLTAVDVFAADGATLLGSAWTYGQDLAENDLTALLTARRAPNGNLLAGVAGVKRVVAIEVQTSTDYGDNWTVAAPLTTLAAPNATWGLFHWGGDYAGHDGFAVST